MQRQQDFRCFEIFPPKIETGKREGKRRGNRNFYFSLKTKMKIGRMKIFRRICKLLCLIDESVLLLKTFFISYSHVSMFKCTRLILRSTVEALRVWTSGNSRERVHAASLLDDFEGLYYLGPNLKLYDNTLKIKIKFIYFLKK